jgi:hypothetical protein
MLLSIVTLAVDGTIAYLLTFLHYAFFEIMGDLMLAEAAALFIIAGLVDFSASLGAVAFRKIILKSKGEYSAITHKEYERKASVFLIAGLILLGILVLVAAYSIS